MNLVDDDVTRSKVIEEHLLKDREPRKTKNAIN
jgi:hypothetical protein